MNYPSEKSGSDFVKAKLRSFAGEILPQPSNDHTRARKETRTALSKIMKRAAKLCEMLDEHDAVECARVIREARNATHRIFIKEAGGLVEVPDHKTRLAAVTLELAYREGLPVQRQVEVQAKIEDKSGLLDRAYRSPALRRHLQQMLDQANKVQGIQQSESENSCST
jgi:hypothetical protein